jgi:hypothetical protein
MGEYSKARSTDEIVGIDSRWLMKHLSDFVDKKENAPKWLSIWIKYLFGEAEILISDPTIAGEILKDNTIIDKRSGIAKIVFNVRLRDSLIALVRSSH